MQSFHSFYYCYLLIFFKLLQVSVDFLVNLGVPFLKVGSGDANNLLLLEKAAKTNLPIVYSTGNLVIISNSRYTI